MTKQDPSIGEFMTLQPQTIEVRVTVADALALMGQAHIRHLPVMQGSRLVGVVSERELGLASAIESIDPHQLLVFDVCSQEPYVVSPETPLRHVVQAMAKRHLGSALITDSGRLVGIFTTVDACRILGEILDSPSSDQSLEIIRLMRMSL